MVNLSLMPRNGFFGITLKMVKRICFRFFLNYRKKIRMAVEKYWNIIRVHS